MSKQFRLPDLGEGLVEAEIVQWLVSVGDDVELNQPLAEVETAKAIVELPSPYAGTILELHAEAGLTVAVGSPLVTVSSEDPGSAGESRSEETREPTLVGYGAAPSSGERPTRRRKRAPGASPAAVQERAIDHPAPAGTRTRPRSSPPVRVYARALGVDLEELAASHEDRAITRGDIDAAHARSGIRDEGKAAEQEAATAGAKGQSPSSPTENGRGEARIPVRGVRKQTAAAMVRSAFTAPQVTVFHTIDVTETLSLIAELRGSSERSHHSIGLLAVVGKAVCLALRAVPELNASWDEQTGEIVQYRHVDLGIAVATERGLIVPHIRSAHALGLPELARELRELAATGREGKTPLERLTGGTFSITNIGVFGVETGTPLLPPGQSGILALGAVRKQPWEHRGEIALREVLTLSLSFDHRVVDGAEGSRFLRATGELLQHPSRAMLYV